MELLIEKVDDLISYTLNEEDIPILKSMRDQLLRGKQLSEKQINFLNVISSRSNIKIEYIDLNEDVISFVKAIQSKIYYGTSPIYWTARPGTYNRCCKIFNLFESELKISKENYSYLRTIFKGWSCEWDEASNVAGQLRYINIDRKTPVIVVGNRGFNNRGDITVDVLAEGKITPVPFKQLKKR